MWRRHLTLQTMCQDETTPRSEGRGVVSRVSNREPRHQRKPSVAETLHYTEGGMAVNSSIYALPLG